MVKTAETKQKLKDPVVPESTPTSLSLSSLVGLITVTEAKSLVRDYNAKSQDTALTPLMPYMEGIVAEIRRAAVEGYHSCLIKHNLLPKPTANSFERGDRNVLVKALKDLGYQAEVLEPTGNIHVIWGS